MCALCGYPFPHAVSPGAICAACTKRRLAFDAARAALFFNDARRKIILRAEYADRTRYANAFGAWIFRAGAELVPLVDVVVPVLLHLSRLIGRQYNQSLLLARAVAGLGRLPVIPDACSGTEIRQVRAASLVGPGTGTFRACSPCVDPPKSRESLLIDDVYTNGATVEACAHALKRGGAKQNHVLTLARKIWPQ